MTEEINMINSILIVYTFKFSKLLIFIVFKLYQIQNTSLLSKSLLIQTYGITIL